MEKFNIEPQEFYVIDRIEGDNTCQFILIPIEEPQSCPNCRSLNIKKSGEYHRYIRDLNLYEKQVGLEIKSHRYLCKDCKRSFLIEFDSVDNRAQMTKRMRNYISKQSLIKPFKVIADELGVSEKTVKICFKDYVNKLDDKRTIYTPKILGIDENHIKGRFRAVFSDIENKLLIDMLPKRNKYDVVKYLKSLPNPERLECVTMDMWQPYKDAVKDIYGDRVKIVIDKFHVLNELNRCLDTIRIRLRDEMERIERKNLRANRFHLLSDKNNLNAEQLKSLDNLFIYFPVFKEPYELKEKFRLIYKTASNSYKAKELYAQWKDMAISINEYNGFCKTVDNWYDEIFNYFDNRCTNATTEYLNRLINEINAKGKGYSFEVLRAKSLYGTKATKQPKFEFKKPNSDFHANDMSLSFALPIRDDKELIHGSGVDIYEMLELLNNDEF